MSPVISFHRAWLSAVALTLTAAGAAAAQSAAAHTLKRPTVCAQGVRVFNDPSQAPTPRDTVEIPRPDSPVRVSSPVR